eukprot:snap_masked-scaffold_37-processed-gene-2.81-mRNA-1 protein AED:1.00 eAED:1.00 QI:0/0/0/0/1/1/2/0/63
MSIKSLALSKSDQDLEVAHPKDIVGVEFKTFMNSLKELLHEDLGSESQFEEEMYNVMRKFQDH